MRVAEYLNVLGLAYRGLGLEPRSERHGRDCDGPRLRGAASSFDFGAGGHVVGHGVGNGVVGTRRTGRAGHSAPSALSSLLELEAGVVEHRVAVGHVGRRSVLCRVLRRVGSSGSTSGGGESSLGRYLPRDTSLAGRPTPRGLAPFNRTNISSFLFAVAHRRHPRSRQVRIYSNEGPRETTQRPPQRTANGLLTNDFLNLPRKRPSPPSPPRARSAPHAKAIHLRRETAGQRPPGA